jgi:nitrite reductase (NADH) small subunit
MKTEAQTIVKTNEQWVRITQCENIPLREGRAVNVGGRDIAVFNLGDRFLAVENRCPHQGGPLADGIVSGTSVVCPLHAWKVDLESGTVARPANTASCVRTLRTRVEEGIVLLETSALYATVQQTSVEEIACHSAPVTVLQPALEQANPA